MSILFKKVKFYFDKVTKNLMKKSATKLNDELCEGFKQENKKQFKNKLNGIWSGIKRQKKWMGPILVAISPLLVNLVFAQGVNAEPVEELAEELAKGVEFERIAKVAGALHYKNAKNETLVYISKATIRVIIKVSGLALTCRFASRQGVSDALLCPISTGIYLILGIFEEN